MKLLICTQALDKNHPILGFFHRWVEEFAKHCEVVHVICLIEGEQALPANVHVHSLGKEHGKNRLRELWRFYQISWKLRNEYDSVFVHMNQVYVILGAWFWRLYKKRIGFWYMHGTVSTSLKWAEKMSHVIFTGSKESFRLLSNKLVITGHGIDTARFQPLEGEQDIDLITVGRITRSKNIEALLEALALVRKSHSVTLTIVGQARLSEEVAYERELKEKTDTLNLRDAVIWHGAATNAFLPAILNRARVFVHAATNGSLDKALLEALACGIAVVSSAPGARSLLPVHHTKAAPEDLATGIITCLQEPKAMSATDRHTYVAENHSILSLIPNLLTHL